MVGGLPFPERKLTKFLIMFDNSNLLYFPGQFLSGRVIVELQEEMAITGTMLNTHPCLNLCSNMSIIIYSSFFAGNIYLLNEQRKKHKQNDSIKGLCKGGREVQS